MGYPRKIWDVIDWSHSDIDIAIAVGVTQQCVAWTRKKRGKPAAGRRGGDQRSPEAKAKAAKRKHLLAVRKSRANP